MPHRSATATLRELWEYRVYLKYETLGRIKIRHKGTYLGYVWWILDPLIFLGIFYFVFGVVFRRGGSNYVVFLFTALLPWRWFVTSVMEACLAFRSSTTLIKQVYFPKLISPLTAIFTNTVSFLVGLIVLAALLAVYRIAPGPALAYFPLVVLTQLAFTIGLGLILADMDVFMKDTSVLLRHLLQIWFYASPGIYAIEQIPPRYQILFRFNPFTVLFESYRDVLIHDRQPHLLALTTLLTGSLLLIALGVALIARHQGEYAKIL